MTPQNRYHPFLANWPEWTDFLKGAGRNPNLFYKTQDPYVRLSSLARVAIGRHIAFSLERLTYVGLENGSEVAVVTAHLAQIIVYPIKSLDGVEVTSAKVLPTGALDWDRRYAIVDSEGQFVNGKRCPLVHRIRAEFQLENSIVRFESPDGETSQDQHLDHDRTAIADWLSRTLGFAVTLIDKPDGGFPDDTDLPGPTVLSTATLARIAEWFPSLDVTEIRRRFRANLEVGGVGAFDEDRLFSDAGQSVVFAIGEVVLCGVNPCQRCAVPTRDSHSGQPMPLFQKQFSERRAAELPSFVNRSRFDHFYRLAVNTRLVRCQNQACIRIGDEVRVL